MSGSVIWSAGQECGERCEERDFRGDHKRGVQDSEDLRLQAHAISSVSRRSHPLAEGDEMTRMRSLACCWTRGWEKKENQCRA